MSGLLNFLSGSFLGNLAGAALILIAGLIFIKIASSIMKRALSRSHLDEAVHKFIINVIRAVLYIVLTVVILGKLKVPTAPLVTVLGAAGAAIALALKDSLGNIAGGVLILANKLFKKGDVIDVSGVEGMVESIDLFVTTLKTYDNKVVICDRELLQRGHQKSRLRFQCGIRYGHRKGERRPERRSDEMS